MPNEIRRDRGTLPRTELGLRAIAARLDQIRVSIDELTGSMHTLAQWSEALADELDDLREDGHV